MSSVSLPIMKAPSSNIHSAAGNPTDTPQADLSTRMNSAFVSGCGDAIFTGPSNVLLFNNPQAPFQEFALRNPRLVRASVAGSPAKTNPAQPQQNIER